LTALVELVRKKNLFRQMVTEDHPQGGGFHDGKRRGAIEQQAGCGNTRFEPRYRE
jgi:hypothetical protein